MDILNADVIVIGGGASGLTTAVTAALGGAKTIVFEKSGSTGGAANLASGLFAVESRVQKEKNITVTRDEVFKKLMEYSHWGVDAQLVRAYIDKSGDTIEWLEKLGVKFREVTSHIEGASKVWHLVDGYPPPPLPMMKILAEKARELGVQIFTSTPAKKINKLDNGSFEVLAEKKSGEKFQANAKAVIIGTGSFADNPEMVKEYTGFTSHGRDTLSLWIPGLDGDGIKMAWDVGAASSQMSIHLGASWPMPVGGPIKGMEFGALRRSNLMVNLQGERFTNEELTENNPYLGHAVGIQKEQCAFMIIDEKTAKFYEEKEKEMPLPDFMVKEIQPGDLAMKIKKVQEKGYEYLFIADSLVDLCKQTGINLDGLRNTIKEYNAACEKGVDNLFNKRPENLKPVKEPRYFAAKYVIRAGGCMGGIKINHRTEVLDKSQDIIPGLYAVGNDANAIYGEDYPMILAGNMLGFAVNSGRIAGEQALEYIKK